LVQFESEFGIKVECEIVPSAFELVERMKSGRSNIDILVPPDYAVLELGSQNRLLSLNHSLLPNLKHLEPRFQRGRFHDPESRLSITKDWGTTGFMYRADIISEEATSWADFWRLAAKFAGLVTVLDSPAEVIGAALKKRGHSYNSSLVNELNDARDDLMELRQYLHSFETDYKPLLTSGDVCLSLGWNGDAAALMAQGLPIRYVVPSEGSQFWEDDWAIAIDTPHVEAAHQFLNFVLDPTIAVQEARYTRYATANSDAWQMLEDALREDESTYPPPEILRKLESGMPQDAEGQKRREDLWKQIR
jgi:spermidine/putrescine transport system substrate-binding protein